MNNSTRLISDAIDRMAPRKNQAQIAREIGYRANMLSMIRKGATRAPFEIIPDLAKALELDPALLFRVLMSDYWPDREKIIAQIFGTVLTTDELQIITTIRAASAGRKLTVSPEMVDEIAAIFTR